MTDDATTAHLAMLRALWESAADNESAPWCERAEEQMSFHAETFDHETGQSRRLRRTR